jgi:hypothetical protein
VVFGIGFVALFAAESLEAVSMATKSLTCGLTGMAGHGAFSLCFAEKSATIPIGSKAWVTPRFGFAPPLVTASDGALIC